ncbi:hypothetical protein TNIN_213731 [Trichonephila inaurata madagascariensis]|uniref:Uncharacterized protein n=1 Tax=Trichonephila inaurata madagascariensis TaxID=2747483 RepID=A0A8X6X6H9_9ARAC|nr:hypothetical protein TNIN_213731 [Trichonephila inaurata madagascariensis]
MVKGVASISKMSSDSDSDMEMNSENSGHTLNSRSYRSGTSTSMTPITDCQRFKMTMNKLYIAEDAILQYEERSSTPIKTPEPVVTQNDFEILEQDVEPPNDTENNVDNVKKN